MIDTSVFDNRLRPALEFLPGIVSLAAAAGLTFRNEDFLPILNYYTVYVAVLLVVLGAYRCYQGFALLRYRKGLRVLPRYALTSKKIPTYRKRLFLGRGFRWTQRHSQRLIEARDPKAQRFLAPTWCYQMARQIEHHVEHTFLLHWLSVLLRLDSALNPVRPEPELGGDSFIHGVGLEDEKPVYMNLSERVGHTLVLGTPGVGKTRLLELLVTQDIKRSDVVIVIDPKGDFGVLSRMIAEATRANRMHHFHMFHLGHPEWSERYNGIGDFGRITEVAGRISNQLPSEGNSAAFREFAWRFTNIVAKALVGLGQKPTYELIARYIMNIEPLVVDYYRLWLSKKGPENWRELVQTLEGQESLMKMAHPALKSKNRHTVALLKLAQDHNLFDGVANGLRSAIEFDKAHFDKLTASLLPLVDKLTTGPVGKILSPDYSDASDTRPILDWMNVIREGGIVYVGLDALSDPDVAAAVGNSMFADLTSIAGRIYKHGNTYGLPRSKKEIRRVITIHADEFNELMGDEFIPMVNKGRGAGLQMNAYTQTLSDVEARIGNRAKAAQTIGNFNNVFMLRPRNMETAELMTKELPKVRVYTKTTDSRVTDDNNPETETDFISQNSDRNTEQETDIITAADVMSLPKGQAFAVIEGGQLYKLRLPLPAPDKLLPTTMHQVADCIAKGSA